MKERDDRRIKEILSLSLKQKKSKDWDAILKVQNEMMLKRVK